jgi:hypothetical protein
MISTSLEHRVLHMHGSTTIFHSSACAIWCRMLGREMLSVQVRMVLIFGDVGTRRLPGIYTSERP